jgi:hypothetical protein
MARLIEEPNEETLQILDRATALLSDLPFSVDLWKVQNGYFRILNNGYEKLQEHQERGDEGAQPWLDRFKSLGHKLAVKVD